MLRPLALLTLLALVAPPLAAQARKLNASLVPGGRVVDFAVTPDGTRVIYRADQEHDEVLELYSALADGRGAPRKLSPSLPIGADVELFSLSPDGRFAVFEVLRAGLFDLYSAPVDGSTPAVRLNGFGPVEPGRWISPDSRRVVMQALGDTVYGAPIDGGTPAVRLSRNLPGGRMRPVISADSRWVTFQTSLAGADLYTAPLDGSAGPVHIARSSYDPPLLLAAGQHVLFTTGAGPGGSPTLESVPFDGSAPATRLLDLSPRRTELARDGWLVFSGDADHDGALELYRERPDGSALARLGTGAPLRAWEPAPSTAEVVFVEEHAFQELHAQPLDGSRPPRLLNPGARAGTRVGSLRYSPIGRWLVFSSDARTPGAFELFAAPLDGGRAPVRLSAPLVAGGSVAAFEFSADGADLVYLADQRSDERFELFRVPLRMPARRAPRIDVLSGALVLGGDVQSFVVTRDAVIYGADQERDGVLELFTSSLTHPQSESPAPGRTVTR